MNKTMVAILIVLVGMLTFVFIKANEQKEHFNRWTSECMQRKGIVGITGTNKVDCYVNGEITILDICKQIDCN